MLNASETMLYAVFLVSIGSLFIVHSLDKDFFALLVFTFGKLSYVLIGLSMIFRILCQKNLVNYNDRLLNTPKRLDKKLN